MVGIGSRVGRTRPRPVVATHATRVTRAKCGAIADACSWQEHSAMGLEIAGPLSGSNGIACICGCLCVSRSQSVIAGTPIIGQQDYTLHVVHCRLGVADARGGSTGTEQVIPLILVQRVPARVGSIATIGDGQRTPVALQGFAEAAAVISIIIWRTFAKAV